MKRTRFLSIALLTSITTIATMLAATPQDQIRVEGHLAAGSAPVTRFIATQHYGGTYVYAERAGNQTTLLDLSKPNRPKVISEIASGVLVSVSGTNAITTDAPAPAAAVQPQTIRIMDFSNPAQPKVSREFQGVTAFQKLPNGLILVANPEGIWILSEHLALDPDEDARYARKVIYGDSMFQ